MSIKSIEAEELREMTGKEGLILQGCGGPLQEWLDGINDMLTEAGILQNGSRFTDIYVFEHEGLTRLLSICSNNLNQYVKRANETARIYAADIEDLSERLDVIRNQVGLFLRKFANVT